MKEKRPLFIILFIWMLQAGKSNAQLMERPFVKEASYRLSQKNTERLSRVFYLPSKAILPADFYTRHTGFFCQKEQMLIKKIQIPVHLRLGSLSYTRKLEGYRY